MKTYLIEATVQRLKDELQELEEDYQDHINNGEIASSTVGMFEEKIKQYKTMITSLNGSFVLTKLFGFIKKRKIIIMN